MSDPDADLDRTIRRAIGGDEDAVAWVVAHAPACPDPVVHVMAALLRPGLDALDRARALATTSRDRQLVAVAAAHLAGDAELVDALAREHLVDHPDNLVVAWIAAGAEAPEDGSAGR